MINDSLEHEHQRCFFQTDDQKGVLLASEKQQNEIFCKFSRFYACFKGIVIVSARDVRKKFGEFRLQQHYYDII